MSAKFRWITTFAIAAALLFGLSGTDQAQPNKLTIWTPEVEPKRVDIQEDLGTRFEEETGIPVEIVPVQQGDLSARVVSAAAGGNLPDIIFVSLSLSLSFVEQGILDAEAATSVIDGIGRDKFADGPLNLVETDAGSYGAVPADMWVQTLPYRKDLFDEKQLDTPNTWEAIREGATSLHNPPDLFGIEVGTDPSSVYMQQIFEVFALSNGCNLVNDQGEVDLTTPECVETFKFYRDMANFSPAGDFSFVKTREDYHSGRTAMTIWSPFLLDELAGLRDSVPVTAEFDEGPPLHRRTGFVTQFQGPSSDEPASWGSVNLFGITTDAAPEAQQLAEFLMTGDEYQDWLSMAPEGKFPGRTDFVDEWRELEVGVDRKAKLGELYDDEVINKLIEGTEQIDRWGFGKGFGACTGQFYGTANAVRIISEYIDGNIPTAEEAAQRMNEVVRGFDACS